MDGIVAERTVLFAEAHAYGAPPLDVSHDGGVFTTRTMARRDALTVELKKVNQQVVEELNLRRGVFHGEFLKAASDGRIYFIEIAARVGGAYICNVVRAATGIDLWREWAKLEVGDEYRLPEIRGDYAGVILSLARQQEPDTSSYMNAEIVERISKYHHAGFVVKSESETRVEELLREYTERFQEDFLAREPVPDRPTS